ncbi:hypothetical protein GH714_016744 [Hevea brasiliensis]|uniref:DUF6469 domain-containing protein n=1 Tax=Hevea brasiliensis TaxID=3981 RepID=A0A6A6LDJ8_HEVBR|nr:hypothetical protein GH714_016744 [Hevea brasiliensis]
MLNPLCMNWLGIDIEWPNPFQMLHASSPIFYASSIWLQWSTRAIEPYGIGSSSNSVKVIPKLFESVDHYFRSYVCPLLEETRARLHSSIEIIYRAPTAEVLALTPCRHDETLLYDVEIDYWRNRYNDRGKEPYKTLPGDVVILADAKPEDVSDLQREGRTWTLALVTQIPEDPEDETEDPSRDPRMRQMMLVQIQRMRQRMLVHPLPLLKSSSKDIEINAEMQKSLVVIFLTNITTNRRIWNRLHKFRNLDVIKEVADSMVRDFNVIIMKNDSID